MTCTTRRAATAGAQFSRMLSHARAREEIDMFRVLVYASLLSTRRLSDILVCHLFDLSFWECILFRELRQYA